MLAALLQGVKFDACTTKELGGKAFTYECDVSNIHNDGTIKHCTTQLAMRLNFSAGQWADRGTPCSYSQDGKQYLIIFTPKLYMGFFLQFRIDMLVLAYLAFAVSFCVQCIFVIWAYSRLWFYSKSQFWYVQGRYVHWFWCWLYMDVCAWKSYWSGAVKSLTGFFITFADCPVMWTSNLQTETEFLVRKQKLSLSYWLSTYHRHSLSISLSVFRGTTSGLPVSRERGVWLGRCVSIHELLYEVFICHLSGQASNEGS